jgi:hypothetical protein
MYLGGWRRKLPRADSRAAALEKALPQETYARGEEGLLDRPALHPLGMMFPHINAPGILLMFALQVIGLIGVASMLGVDKVVILLERCTRRSDFPEAKATEARSHSRPPKPVSSARPWSAPWQHGPTDPETYLRQPPVRPAERR